MRYNLERLKLEYNQGDRLKFLFFWGHQKSKNEEITKTCFSQWWMADFEVDGTKYSCMEQFMMSEKASLFRDMEIHNKIMGTRHPKQMKEFGRSVKNFDEEIWKDKRYQIVCRGNECKFSQNESLKQFLVQTNNRILVEASPYDKIWGIGMSANDENIENPLIWKGLNLLGFALMEVRDMLLQ